MDYQHNINKYKTYLGCGIDLCFCCRHGLHKNWNQLTIFVLHLSFCDVLYCSICLPFYASVYLGYPWQFGEAWCVASISLAFIFAYVDWMALSLIALSRALSISAPQILNKFCTNVNSKCVIVSVWIFIILFMIPSFLEVGTYCFAIIF